MRKLSRSHEAILSRLHLVEVNQLTYEEKFDKLFSLLENASFPDNKGVFFEDTVFDAHVFVSKLIKTAKEEIILIDNYVDESVLLLLSKRKKNVRVIIYTKNISKELLLDIEKFTTQYGLISVKEFMYSHDRFLILDGAIVYHFGASLKDLGKKWFAFSKFGLDEFDLLSKLKFYDDLDDCFTKENFESLEDAKKWTKNSLKK